jgi:hypothetical protein
LGLYIGQEFFGGHTVNVGGRLVKQFMLYAVDSELHPPAVQEFFEYEAFEGVTGYFQAV